MNILLVDDSKMVLETLNRSLTAYGHTLDTAVNGADALKYLGKAIPDLIISDINMPQMNGLTFLQVIRKRFPELPVILMTGIRNRDVAAAASQNGATEYFKKPIRFEELLTCLKKVERQIAA